jgi:probable F420-dependent oxidoreductase
VDVDVIWAGELADVVEGAERAERIGADGIVVSEVAHDPFLPAVLAARSTERIRVATGIAVAFARNPMTVAVTASDLQRLSGGRFVLGLGSQIKAHVTRRFSMPWSAPVPRMREFVAAVRAIWRAWEDGAPLAFDGDFYQHDLMTPMFSHGPSPCGWPPIVLAGVGPAMSALAGEVADGFMAHGFTTASYLHDVTLPQIERGLARDGRQRSELELSVPAMTVVAADPDPGSLTAMRATIAFYGSTPAYRPVLDHHGWGALGDELHALSRRGEWAAMADLVDDEVLHTFAAVGDVATVADELHRRFGDVADRIQLGLGGDERASAELVAAVRRRAADRGTSTA